VRAVGRGPVLCWRSRAAFRALHLFGGCPPVGKFRAACCAYCGCLSRVLCGAGFSFLDNQVKLISTGDCVLFSAGSQRVGICRDKVLTGCRHSVVIIRRTGLGRGPDSTGPGNSRTGSGTGYGSTGRLSVMPGNCGRTGVAFGLSFLTGFPGIQPGSKCRPAMLSRGGSP